MHVDTLKRPIPCLWWVLGILLLGTALWYLLFTYVSANEAVSIQQDIQGRSSAALATQAQLVNVTSTVDGRDVVLTGAVSSEEDRQQAEKIARTTKGVRTVLNEITIGKLELKSEPVAPKYELRSSAKVDPLPQSFPLLEDELEQQETTDFASAQQAINNLDLRSISFLLGSATLTENATTTLAQVVEALNQHSELRLRVEGHTDNTGDPNFNLALSTERAQSVVNYLINQGIQESRLVAEGFGDRQPIASNDTREGRVQNRRIEFKLLNGEN